MYKEIKKKNKKTKGFTLVELVIAVLIIGVIGAISMPMYFRAVEKSRATEAFSVLGSIAKAQQRTKLATNEFTDKLAELDINPKFYSQQDESSFDTQYFDFTLGTEKAQAERKTGASEEYALNIDYETGKITCTPKNGSTMCARLGIEEVEESDVSGDSGDWPKTESCDASNYEGDYYVGFTNVGINNDYFTCTRYLYGNGPVGALLCPKSGNNGSSACYFFDNDGNKIAMMMKLRGGKSISPYVPGTDHKVDSMSYYNDGSLMGRMVYTDDLNLLYDIKYNDPGAPYPTSITFYLANDAVERVNFNSETGAYTSSTCVGGDCSGFVPPTNSDAIISTLRGRTETNCLDAFSDYPMLCPNAS